MNSLGDRLGHNVPPARLSRCPPAGSTDPTDPALASPAPAFAPLGPENRIRWDAAKLVFFRLVLGYAVGPAYLPDQSIPIPVPDPFLTAQARRDMEAEPREKVWDAVARLFHQVEAVVQKSGSRITVPELFAGHEEAVADMLHNYGADLVTWVEAYFRELHRMYFSSADAAAPVSPDSPSVSLRAACTQWTKRTMADVASMHQYTHSTISVVFHHLVSDPEPWDFRPGCFGARVQLVLVLFALCETALTVDAVLDRAFAAGTDFREYVRDSGEWRFGGVDAALEQLPCLSDRRAPGVWLGRRRL